MPDFPVLDPWQFRLFEAETAPTPALGRFVLEAGAGMSLYPLTDGAGQAVGGLIGFPIDLETETMVTGPVQLSDTLGSDPDRFAQQVLLRFAGNFGWIFVAGQTARVYPDAGALMSMVYDPQAKVLGSTAHALLADPDYEARRDHALYDHLDVGRAGWFPAGLTAHHGISRLLAGHYVDLQDWTARRHWPTGPLEGHVDPVAATAEIIANVRRQINALVGSDRRAAFGLTGGQETRSLLACARDVAKDVDFVTVTGSDRHATDTIIASRITRGEGLNHILMPRVACDAARREQVIRRNGHCVADVNAIYPDSTAPISGTHHLIGGLGGEFSRGFYWRPTDHKDTQITIDQMLGRYAMVPNDTLRAAMQRWMDGLPTTNTLEMFDLAYQEHRNCAWACAQFYFDPTLIRFHPLVTQRNKELMYALPDDWKRQHRLSAEMVRQTWPELADYPLNSLGRFHDTKVKVQRVLADPKIIIDRWRKRR